MRRPHRRGAFDALDPAAADRDPERVARTSVELIESETVAERVERGIGDEVDLDADALLDRVMGARKIDTVIHFAGSIVVPLLVPASVAR